MKKVLGIFLIFTVVAAAGMSAYAYVGASSETFERPIQSNETEVVSTCNAVLNAEQGHKQEKENNDISSSVPVPTSFPTTQDEIVYKMLNSMDYFTTAKVSFSAIFPSSDVAQNYTIETNLDTGISHQVCSDNFVQTRSADTNEAYETYSDGKVVRQYNNLDRTVQTISGVVKRRTLSEEWPGIDERYYIDENGEPHYRYRGNPTNADMAGECLLPQVSAFAYLMDKELWEAAGEVDYCNRSCYFIKGIVNDSYSAQIGAVNFMMYVDKTTGILLKLEASDEDGKVVSSMVVSEISIDFPVTRSAFKYDMSKYEDYTVPSGSLQPLPVE